MPKRTWQPKVRRRKRVRHEGERRNTFLRYLNEVATAVSTINRADRDELFTKLVRLAKSKTAEADVKLDDRGRPIEENLEDLGDNVLIVDPSAPPSAGSDADTETVNVGVRKHK